MIYPQVYQHLKDLPFYQFAGLKYKIIHSQVAKSLNFEKAKMPKIFTKDPLLKAHPLVLEAGDVIAIYRDYELKIDPYYYFRVLIKKL